MRLHFRTKKWQQKVRCQEREIIAKGATNPKQRKNTVSRKSLVTVMPNYIIQQKCSYLMLLILQNL